MTNLLPPQVAREARQFIRDRFVFVGSIVSILCSVVVLFAFVPAYLVVQNGVSETTPSPTISESSDREALVRARAIVAELQPLVSSTSSVITLFDDILEERPDGITVSRIRYMRSNPSTIVVEGLSQSREAINEYRAELSNDARFQSVSVPIGALAGIEDGRFTVTLMGTF